MTSLSSVTDSTGTAPPLETEKPSMEKASNGDVQYILKQPLEVQKDGAPVVKHRWKDPKSWRTPTEWFKKYFFYGQTLTKPKEAPPADANWFTANFWYQRPYWVTVVVPLILVCVIWGIVMTATNNWKAFGKEPKTGVPGWKLTITMLFGSMIAGATSEGGGSIAFPVMTLILGLPASVARDFSLMIQSIGMTSASFTIWYSKLLVEKTAVIFCTIGGLVGVIIGLQWVAPAMPSDYSKMVFVSIWLAFALNLLYLNCQRHRRTHMTIKNPSVLQWISLFFVGVVGGVLSAISGSGLDIATFSILTLYYRVTEKTATPTSVVLMAINTCAGFFYRAVVMRGENGIASETWHFWAASVPIVTIGAPVGAFVSSFLHRQVLASFVYITDVTQFVLACIIVPLNVPLIITTVVLVTVSLAFFFTVSYIGSLKMRYYSKKYPLPAAQYLPALSQQGKDAAASGNETNGFEEKASSTDKVSDKPSDEDKDEKASASEKMSDKPSEELKASITEKGSDGTSSEESGKIADV